MTLLREIQLLLERTYAPVPINLEACVIGESRCAVLSRLAGEETAQLAPADAPSCARPGIRFTWRSSTPGP